MVNKSTNINNANNYLASLFTEHKYKTTTYDVGYPGPGLRHLYIFLGPMDTLRLIRIQIQVIVTIHSDWDADVLLENSTTQTWHICLSIESPPISEWYRGCIYTVYQCDILLTNQMNRSVTCFLTKEIV
jgi:hypothetical protein